jgi:hypothetical protein
MGNRRFKILRDFILFALSVGLMKPQRGSTPIMGKEKTGRGQVRQSLTQERDFLKMFGNEVLI